MGRIEPSDRYLNANNLRLHYLEWGNKDLQPMLLLHGFMGHAHIWDGFAVSMKDSYRVIALDQRGHGGSDRSESMEYSIDEYFSDLDQFVELLELRNFILVGHSMGGRNALFYVALTSGNVACLILIDSRPSDNIQAEKCLKDQISTLPLKAKSIDEVVTAIVTLYPYLSLNIARHMASRGFKYNADGTYVPLYDHRMNQQIIRAKYRTENLFPFMKNVGSPTLIVRGKESAFLSREDALRICQAIPKAEWKEVPRATHMPAQENPVAFRKIVTDFLNKY